VTIRHRDSMEQERVAVKDLSAIIDLAVNAKHWLKKMN
jgi:glycyl-tRNA synthetase